VNASRYYSWVVMDIENWGGRPGSAQARMQQALRGVVARALSACSVEGADVRRTSRGDGVILGLSTEIAKETITGPLFKSLNRELRLYDDECPPDEVMRLRIALHAGDAHDGGDEWAGKPVNLACRLVDSEILHRVLAAASTAVLATIVSDDWYDAVLREGWADPVGFDPVVPNLKDYDGGAWIRVPGHLHPPGLRPSDVPGEQQEAAPHAEASVPGNGPVISIGGNVGRDVIGGNSTVVNYGHSAEPRRGGSW